MLAAIGWGGLAAGSLLLGVLLGLARPWPGRLVGLVLAFGAGALIAAVSFELALQGVGLGGTAAMAAGLGAGALTYFGLDRLIDRVSSRRGTRPVGPGRAPPVRAAPGPGAAPGLSAALALGALLDGIPEQVILGIGLSGDIGVNAALLLAIVVSNVPEAVGSAADMRTAGQPVMAVWRLWIPVAVACTAATAGGYAVAGVVTGRWPAVLNGFAAGALLVMLIDSMIPAAAARAGPTAGLATVLGFAIATWLSLAS